MKRRMRMQNRHTFSEELVKAFVAEFFGKTDETITTRWFFRNCAADHEDLVHQLDTVSRKLKDVTCQHEAKRLADFFEAAYEYRLAKAREND